MMRGKALFAVIALTSLFTGCGGATSTTSGANDVKSSTNPAPVVGKQAPSFSLPQLNGNGTVSLQTILAHHQPVILNVFASWCEPCNNEAPDFVQAAHKYRGKVQFVGIDMTSTEMNERGPQDFVDKYKIPYTVLKDPHAAFMNAYGVYAAPQTFVLSPTGRIIDIEPGMLTASKLDAVVQKALNPS
jgi:cytochrome c biogenesis protein CcmG/thiol:disulfide interchange protein DsbE